MACGFQTENGSFYAFDPTTNKTLRFKSVSGKPYEQSLCLFVPPKAMRHLEKHYLGTGHMYNTLRLGSIDRDNLSTFKKFGHEIDLSAGRELWVAVINKSTAKIVCSGGAQREPAEGFVPIEKCYNPDNTSATHVGNRIIKVYHTREAFAKDAPKELLDAVSEQQRRGTGFTQTTGAGVKTQLKL
ncbi:MAG: hypothetical protein WC464_02600 [Bdellovibrionales bacterium]